MQEGDVVFRKKSLLEVFFILIKLSSQLFKKFSLFEIGELLKLTSNENLLIKILQSLFFVEPSNLESEILLFKKFHHIWNNSNGFTTILL